MLARSLSVPSAALLFLACGKSNDNCPGQCSDEAVLPTMTITTDDGSASIASARITNGRCAAVLMHSSGEAGAPQTYGVVQLTYSGPRDTPTPPMCIVEMTSASGQVNTVSVQPSSHPQQQICCPYGSCCLADAAVSTRYRVQFDQPTQTFSFPPLPDGGPGQDAADALDATPDAPALDDAAPSTDSGSSSQIDALDLFDLADFDLSPVDSPSVDMESVDSFGTIDLASGS